jgi:hypothetical protein
MQWTTETKEVDVAGRGVGQRRDQRLIHPARLAELEELAQDGQDMRAALNTLSSKRLQMMEAVRTEAVRGVTENIARGWLEFESDLGDALLEIQRKRGEEAPF